MTSPTLGNFANSATVSGVETLTGGSAADTITLGAAATNATIDLGVGSDKLTLGNFANDLTVTNVETLTGGNLADTVTPGQRPQRLAQDRPRRRQRQALPRRCRQHGLRL